METQRDRQAASAAAAGLWWVVLIMGIVWFVIALVVLRINETSITTVGVIMGVVLVFGALGEMVAVGLVEGGGWRIWHAILSVLFLLAAIWAFTEPKQAFWALASVLGFMLLLVGVFEIARAFAMKEENEGWWLSLTAGILYIVLAFWVSQQLDPVKGQLLLFIVGIFALLRGISEIVLAFALRSAGKQLARA